MIYYYNIVQYLNISCTILKNIEDLLIINVVFSNIFHNIEGYLYNIGRKLCSVLFNIYIHISILYIFVNIVQYFPMLHPILHWSGLRMGSDSGPSDIVTRDFPGSPAPAAVPGPAPASHPARPRSWHITESRRKTAEKYDPKCLAYQNIHGLPRQLRLRNLRSEGHEIGLAKGLGFRTAGSAEPSDSDFFPPHPLQKWRFPMDGACTQHLQIQIWKINSEYTSIFYRTSLIHEICSDFNCCHHNLFFNTWSSITLNVLKMADS